MIPIKLIALVIVTFALAGLMVPTGVSNTAFAQSADEIIENVESSVSEEITAFLDEDDDDGNDEEEEEVETEEGDNGGASGEDSQNLEQAIDQVNENEVDQDSSANDNVLVNENEFGDQTNTQIAVPISDQDQTAENRAINLDIEQQPATPTDDGVPPPPEEQDAFFCITGLGTTICFESLAECESLQVGVPFCQRFETFPEGAVLCTVEEGLPVCQV